jgi:endopeptidase Clp ATP-binding regulatory subunit ClpX
MACMEWVIVMSKDNFPGPGDLEKELNDYLIKKYGNRIRLSVPFMSPEHAVIQKDEKDNTKEKTSEKFNFNLKPEELEAYLDEYVIKQEKAKEILATKICTHFNRIKYQDRSSSVGNIKNNIIMIGPTGVGKTFLIKLIAKKIGVPFVKGDATKFSETGYVGGDVEDLVRDLVREADGDIEKAQYGIVYIDEIDKIAGGNNIHGLDVSRTGVQRALLKPMEETEVDLNVTHDPVSQLEAVEHFRKTGKREKRVVNTKNILFIVSGAFNDLGEIIEKRLHSKEIGFSSKIKKKQELSKLLHEIKAEDLAKFGFELEFVGRIPVVATFDQLTVDDLYEILKNPNSTVINSKKMDFMAYDIDIRFEDGSLRKIAEMAAEEKTGARGLVSAIERVLLKFEKGLPSTGIKKLVVTEDIVIDPVSNYNNMVGSSDLSAIEARHLQLIENEEAKLKKRLLSTRDSLDEEWQFLLDDICIDNIVRIAVEKYIDYKKVLDDAIEVVKEVREAEKKFKKTNAIEILFDDTAINVIIKTVLLEGHSIKPILKELFLKYFHGLKLVKDKTGKNLFVFSEEAVKSPNEYLNNLIKDLYK